jgi:hypothetical protein
LYPGGKETNAEFDHKLSDRKRTVMATDTSENPEFSSDQILKQAKASVTFLDFARAQALQSSTQGSATTNRLFLDLLSSVNQYLGELSFEDKGLEKQRDDFLSANIARGMQFDPDFASKQKGVRAIDGAALENEHGDTVPLVKLEARSLELENVSRRIKESAGQLFSRTDTTTSKDILLDAVQSSDASSNSIHAALTHDIELRNKRRSVWTTAKRVWHDPGFEKQRNRKRSDYRDAREKSINLAVDAIMRSRDIEGGAVRLARAIASDQDLRSAFKYHRKFQELMRTVNHSGLNRLCEEIATDPNKPHPLSLPNLSSEIRLQRSTAGAEQASDLERKETAPISGRRAQGDDGLTRASDGIASFTGIRRHEHYTGKFDRRGSPLLSNYSGTTKQRHLTQLAVPGGRPIDLLHDTPFTPGQLNKIRENLHLARIGTTGNDTDSKRLRSFLARVPVKITEDTGWESRTSGKRVTRKYVEGVGEISRDKSALYIKPAEMLSDDGVQTILRRARATLGLPYVEQSIEVRRDEEVEQRDLFGGSTLDDEKTDVNNTESTFSRDDDSVLVGVGSNARLLKLNDSLRFTKECSSAEMMEEDVGIIRSFDHANSVAMIEDVDGRRAPMNYKEFHDFTIQETLSIQKAVEDDHESLSAEENQASSLNSILAGTGSNPRQLKIGDTLLFTEACDSADMQPGDSGTVRSFNQNTGDVYLEDSGGFEVTMKYREFHGFIIQEPISVQQGHLDDQKSIPGGEYHVSASDDNSIEIGSGPEARRLRIGDELLFTQDCDSAAMMENDVGILRAFDHDKREALIEDRDGMRSPMNYDTFHDFVIKEPIPVEHARDNIDFRSSAVLDSELVKSKPRESESESESDERDFEDALGPTEAGDAGGIGQGDTETFPALDDSDNKDLTDELDRWKFPQSDREFHDSLFHGTSSVEQENLEEYGNTGNEVYQDPASDHNSIEIGSGPEARRLRIGDELLFTQDCDSAAMMENDVGILRAFDHDKREALIEDRDGMRSPMNYDTFHDFVIKEPIPVEHARDNIDFRSSAVLDSELVKSKPRESESESESDERDFEDALGPTEAGDAGGIGQGDTETFPALDDSDNKDLTDELDRWKFPQSDREFHDSLFHGTSSVEQENLEEYGNTGNEVYQDPASDHNSIEIGSGPEARRLRIGDELLFTQDCDSAAMMENDVGILRAFDHDKREALIEDRDGMRSPMNYDTFHDFVIKEPIPVEHARDNIDLGSPAILDSEPLKSTQRENESDEGEVDDTVPLTKAVDSMGAGKSETETGLAFDHPGAKEVIEGQDAGNFNISDPSLNDSAVHEAISFPKEALVEGKNTSRMKYPGSVLDHHSILVGAGPNARPLKINDKILYTENCESAGMMKGEVGVVRAFDHIRSEVQIGHANGGQLPMNYETFRDFVIHEPASLERDLGSLESGSIAVLDPELAPKLPRENGSEEREVEPTLTSAETSDSVTTKQNHAKTNPTFDHSDPKRIPKKLDLESFDQEVHDFDIDAPDPVQHGPPKDHINTIREEFPISILDNDSIVIGEGPDARRLRVNDELLYTKDCDSAEMMKGDVGTVRAFNHAKSEALIEDSDEALFPMNYKTFRDFVIKRSVSVEHGREDDDLRAPMEQEPEALKSAAHQIKSDELDMKSYSSDGFAKDQNNSRPIPVKRAGLHIVTSRPEMIAALKPLEDLENVRPSRDNLVDTLSSRGPSAALDIRTRSCVRS